ncbi:type III-A CRISPR-associated protein Csm2 [Rodentibacter sp. JRC1]|nr:type III-A CRISPR-associated protein Csm2 [Rodentibacter sp. JRC1]GJI56755.1 type III-A CRISPR-associated protein Csm2 [Rodentibacter sp. JRC1]
MDIRQIKFGTEKSPTIFSDIAEQAAIYIKTDIKTGRLNKEVNKSTQLRKFYDELCLWNDKVQLKRKERENEYKQLEPFIKMLKAKVAYAEGRKHINKHFSEVFNTCINNIQSAETLNEAKLFMEAVIGYCKLEESKSKEY